MLHNLANDVALKQAAEDRQVWRHRERMSTFPQQPAVQQKTTDDDDMWGRACFNRVKHDPYPYSKGVGFQNPQIFGDLLHVQAWYNT